VEERHERPTGRRNHFLAAISAPIIWGFMSIPLRWIRHYPAEDILGYRLLLGLVLLWMFLLLFRRKSLKRDVQTFRNQRRNERLRTVGLTVAASALIFGNWFTYIYAVNHISVQSAAFGYLICPLITAVAAFLLLKEQLSPIKKVALGLAFAGVLMLARGSVTEALWSIAIAGLYAFYLIVQRVFQGFNKLHVLAVQLTVCSLFVVPRLLFNQHPIPQELLFWGITLAIAVVFTIIPLFLSMYALSRISSTTTGVLLYINPLIAFTLAVLYFGESVEGYKYAAYGLILFAIVLFNVPRGLRRCRFFRSTYV